MIDHVLGSALDGCDEGREFGILQPVIVGHYDQLVIGGHAMLFGIKGQALEALNLELVQLEVAKGADHRIDLSRHEGR